MAIYFKKEQKNFRERDFLTVNEEITQLFKDLKPYEQEFNNRWQGDFSQDKEILDNYCDYSLQDLQDLFKIAEQEFSRESINEKLSIKEYLLEQLDFYVNGTKKLMQELEESLEQKSMNFDIGIM